MKNKRTRLPNIPDYIKKISALISAVVVIFTTCASVFVWAQNKLTEHLDGRIASIEATVNEIREDTVRLQLDNLINNDAENIESILTVAKTYFIDMDGDWYMTEKFKRWGREHEVDLSDFKFTRATDSD